jgi:hypothetical protein
MAIQEVIAQNAPLTQQDDHVNCANVMVLQGGVVNLSCTGLTKAQAKLLQTTISGMIERILHANDQHFAEINSKLDSISVTARAGNLRERTIALANAIMTDLYERGWKEWEVTLPPGERVYEHMPGHRDSP